MPSKLMDVLKLAAKWLAIEGVDAVSANEIKQCLEVYVTNKFEEQLNLVPAEFHGFEILVIKPE